MAPTRVTEAPILARMSLTALKVSSGAADHDGQGAFDGLGFAAADGGVEHGDAFLGQFGGDFLAGLGGDGAHVHDDRAGADAFDDAAACRGWRLSPPANWAAW